MELGIWADDRDREAMAEILRQDSSCRALEAQFRKKNREIVLGADFGLGRSRLKVFPASFPSRGISPLPRQRKRPSEVWLSTIR